MLCIVARFTRFTMKECSQGSNILSTLLEFWFVSVRQFDTCFDTSFTCTPTKRDKREDKITSKYGSSLLRCAYVCHVSCAKDKVWCLPSLQYIRCTFPHITISFHRVTCDSIFFIFFLAQSNCSAVSIPISADATCTTLIRMPNAMARNCSNFSAISNAAGLV